MTRFAGLLIRAGLCLLLASCSRSSEEELLPLEVIPVATIQFLAPSPDTIYNQRDSIAIVATAISTASIHGFDLAIRDANASTNRYFIHIHDHNDTLQIHEKWKPDVTIATSLEAEITLYLDHAGHTKKAKVNFRVQ